MGLMIIGRSLEHVRVFEKEWKHSGGVVRGFVVFQKVRQSSILWLCSSCTLSLARKSAGKWLCWLACGLGYDILCIRLGLGGLSRAV